MSKFDTSGSYFAPMGYMRVNAGGSHEENPNGGVQVGMDEQGIPNMLEEGEPVYNDYVYSDNIVADEAILKKNNLPAKYAGKLYSSIADIMVDDAAEMPLDPIANNGLNAMLVRLADAQEEQKAAEQQKELEKELAALSPEELAELEQILGEQEAMQEQAAMQPQEQVPVGAMPMQPGMEQMMPEQPMMACGGKLRRSYWPGGPIRYNRVQWPYENAYNQFDAPLYDGTDEPITPIFQYAIPTSPEPFVLKSYTNDELNYKVPNPTVDSEKWPYGPFYNTGSFQVPLSASRSAAGQPIVTTPVAATASVSTTNAVPVRKAGIKSVTAKKPSSAGTLLTPINTETLSTPEFTQWLYDQAEEQKIQDYIAAEDALKELNDPNAFVEPDINVTDLQKSAQQRQFNALPTWPRYAGAVTSGLLALHNAFQDPDKYTIPRYTPVLPYGRMHLVDPLYRPIDQNQVVNDVLASGADTTRRISNIGAGPSTGALLLAQDYNTGRNLGNALAQAQDANIQRKNAVIAAHNQNESTLGNFHYGQNREHAHILNDAAWKNLHNDLTRQRLNYAAEGEKYAALQQELDNVAEALSLMGRENAVVNMINGDETRRYAMDPRFDPYYSGYIVACGGKIKKSKK